MPARGGGGGGGGGGRGGLHPENVHVSFVLFHKMSVLRLWPFVCVDLLLLLFVCFLGVLFSYNH